MLVALLRAFLSVTPAQAAPASAPTDAKIGARLMRPLTLQSTSDMDFGMLHVTTGGAAIINPNTGALSLTGGLQRIGGTVSPARFIGAATRLSLVIVRSSSTSILLRRSGGTETLRLDNFSIDGNAIRIVTAGTFTFAIGGRLTVPAGAAEGVYTGDMEITAEYF